MTRLWAVSLKELRQIVRDRQSLVVVLLLPVVFLLLYGYALNFDIRHITLTVQDRDDSTESRALVQRFLSSTYFESAAGWADDAEVVDALESGRARVGLIIPEGFGRDRRLGRHTQVQVLVAGDNANTAATVQGYVDALVREAASGASAPLVASRVWFNPELRSALFLVPGLIEYLAMITAVVSTALSIVREKEQGTMEQIRLSPIGMPAFVVGKTLPYLALSLVSSMAVIGASMVLFDLPMAGRWVDLTLVVTVFLIGALGTGVLVSTLAETQQVAFQIATVVAFLPTFILSGFIFPIASMPVVLQYVTTVVPARYFLSALRGVVLKGGSLADVWAPVMALVVYAAAVLAVAAARLRRR